MATAANVEVRLGLDLNQGVADGGQAAKAGQPRAPREAETWATARLADLLRGRRRQVAASLRRRATERRLTETPRAPVEQGAP